MRSPRSLLRTLLVLAVLTPASAAGQPALVPVVVIDGKGFGHGVGMAQDGAYWMGRAGASTNQILSHFFPGTGIGKSSGPVRVNVYNGATEVVLAFPQGGEIRDGRTGPTSDGFPVRVQPGGTVKVSFTGSRYVAQPTSGATMASAAAGSEPASSGPASFDPAQADDPSSTTTTTRPSLPTTSTTSRPIDPTPPPSSTTTMPPDDPAPEPERPGRRREASSTRPLWAAPAGGGTITVNARNRTYRGMLEATALGGPFRIVNEVDVETYLKGMGEVRNPSWPPAALRAQAIAARTYAMRAMSTAGELCDTQRCQVYLGAQAEYAAMNKAVNDSAGQVVVYGRSLASTVYSANGGGFSASREEGFGTTGGGYPYLRPAPYETRDPVPWSVTISLRDVAARLGYAGEITAVHVNQRGPSGRATGVTLQGSAGDKTVNGLSFDAALGLKSTLFTLRLDAVDAPPPPPPPAESLQALPDEVAGAAADDGPVPDLPPGPGDDLATSPHRRDGAPSGLALLALVLQGLALLAVPGARRVALLRTGEP